MTLIGMFEFLLALLLVFSIMGCPEVDETSTPQDPPSVEDEQEEEYEDPSFMGFDYDEDGEAFDGGYLYFIDEGDYYRMYLGGDTTERWDEKEREWEEDESWD